MPVTRIHQSNFSGGEVDPNLISRNDLKAYEKSLTTAKNVICKNQGSVERRGGSYYRANLSAKSRLEPFIFSGSQEYIFAFQNTQLKIYSTNGTLLQTITSCPWTTAQLYDINFTQQGDTMIVVNENWMPRIIKRTGATTFSLSTFAFDESVNGEETYQPYFKFADNTVTLDASSYTAGAGRTITASTSYFTSDYVGTRLKIYNTEVLITGYTSGTSITVTLEKDLEVELDEDPFATQENSGVVKVTHANHGLTTGATVNISGSEAIFDDQGNGLEASSLTGDFTVTVVDDNHYNITAKLHGGSPDVAEESVDGGGVRVVVKTHAPTRDWKEQVLSDVNGYPKAVAFHEQRLYFAGVTNLPDLIAASKISDFFNFDVGDGEDADSVQIQIASDEINEIRHLISGKVLEILTNTAEFYLKPPIGKPVTPTDIQIIRQSSLGCQQKARARIFDGATLFVQTNGKTVREYTYNASTEEFVTAPISILSSHLISSPQDADRIKALANRDEQLYLLVNDDGTLAVFISQKVQELQGWVQWVTDGSIESVCCTTDFIYIAVKRTINGTDYYYLEQMTSDSFDVPTDMTVSKTLSASYQPHGSPLINGSITSSTTFIVDGFTNAPSVGESFQFGGIGTEYTINSVTATGNSGEYVVVIDTAVSQSDNTTLQFTTSKTFTGLNSAPDMRTKTVHATSGSTEGGNINYYGSATVDSNGVAVFDTPASACDIGLSFDLTIKTLPINAKVQSTGTEYPLIGNPTKIAKAIIELSSSYNLQVNGNDVLINETNIDTSSTLPSYTGKKDVYFLGYNSEPTIEITQTAPLPLRVLGITSEVYY